MMKNLERILLLIKSRKILIKWFQHKVGYTLLTKCGLIDIPDDRMEQVQLQLIIKMKIN